MLYLMSLNHSSDNRSRVANGILHPASMMTQRRQDISSQRHQVISHA